MPTVLKAFGLALGLALSACGGGGGAVDTTSAPNTPDRTAVAQSNATVVTTAVIAAVIQ